MGPTALRLFGDVKYLRVVPEHVKVEVAYAIMVPSVFGGKFCDVNLWLEIEQRVDDHAVELALLNRIPVRDMAHGRPIAAPFRRLGLLDLLVLGNQHIEYG